MFPSNFIREIKELVFWGTVIFCSTYTCTSEFITNKLTSRLYYELNINLFVISSEVQKLVQNNPLLNEN
jgi:hypothetical protein